MGALTRPLKFNIPLDLGLTLSLTLPFESYLAQTLLLLRQVTHPHGRMPGNARW